MMSISYHRERISVLLELEGSEAYKNTNYCSSLGIPADQLRRKSHLYPTSAEVFDTAIAPGMMMTPFQRRQIGEWFFLVADYLNVCRDIGTLSLKFFDTVLTRRLVKRDSVSGTNWQEYHLLAATCLFIALKLYRCEGSRGTRIGASSVCALGGMSIVTPKQVIEEEREVLDTLEWRMYPPLPIDFVHSFIEILLLQRDNNEYLDAITERAYYMIDLSALDYFFLDLEILPSCVALSALANGMNMIFAKDSFEDPMIVIASEVDLNFDQEIYKLCRYRLQILWDSNTDHNSHGSRMSSPVSVMCENKI